MTHSGARNEHSINLKISRELKAALLQLARRRDRSLADLIREALRAGVPVVRKLWDAEDRLIDRSISRFGISRLAGDLVLNPTEPYDRDADHFDTES